MTSGLPDALVPLSERLVAFDVFSGFDARLCEPGVYFLMVGNEVVYVGQSVNPCQRIPQHRPDKIFDRALVLPVDKEQLDSVESDYIKRLSPALNKAGKDRPSIENRLDKIEALLESLAASRRRTKETYSLRQTAVALGVRPATIAQLVAAGSLRTTVIASHVRIARCEIDRVLAEGASLDPPRRFRRAVQHRSDDDEEAEAIAAIRVD